jgi:hypothetical protein
VTAQANLVGVTPRRGTQRYKTPPTQLSNFIERASAKIKNQRLNSLDQLGEDPEGCLLRVEDNILALASRQNAQLHEARGNTAKCAPLYGSVLMFHTVGGSFAHHSIPGGVLHNALAVVRVLLRVE